MTLGVAIRYGTPYYTGTTAPTPGVGGQWDVAIGGRGYMIDWESQVPFRHTSIRQIREQSDTSPEPSEASLNPEDLWRRGQESWHGGAGQTYLDRSDAVRTRYRASKGIDPWTRGQIRLLPAAGQKRASVNSNLAVATVGTHCFILDGATLAYTLDITATTPTFTPLTPVGTALAASAHSLVSDGYTVWAADAADLYYATRGGATYGQWHSAAWANTELARFAKGRLFTAIGASIYNNGAQGSAVPATALLTHPSSDWTWTDVAEGPAAVYLSGFAGDRSAIYRTAIKADGTALDTPVVATTLPDGEIVRGMVGYLGFLLVGTDKGLRFASLAADGNIDTLGALIPISAGVRVLEPQDRFCWFGWTSYDATSSGLGRVDLRTFNDSTPAYASDLMASSLGTVSAVATFQNRRLFAVAGSGFWAETADLVASGTLSTGWFNYGIPDTKTAINLNVRHAAGAGSYTASLGVDLAATTDALGSAVTTAAAAGGGAILPAGPRAGEAFEISYTLTRSATDPTSGPGLTRWTLRADPGSPGAKRITVPLMLHAKIATHNNADRSLDVPFERAFLEDLRSTRQVVQYQEGDQAWTVVVDDFEWLPYHDSGVRHVIDGTFVAVLKTII